MLDNLQKLYELTGTAAAMNFGSTFGGTYWSLVREAYLKTVNGNVYIVFKIFIESMNKEYIITDYFSKEGEDPDTQKSQAWAILSSFQKHLGGNLQIKEKMTTVQVWNDTLKEFEDTNEVLPHFISIEGHSFYITMKSHLKYPRMRINGVEMRELTEDELKLPPEPSHVYIPKYTEDHKWSIKVLLILNKHHQTAKEVEENSKGEEFKKFNTKAYKEQKKSLEEIEELIKKSLERNYKKAGLPMPKVRDIEDSPIADFFESNPLFEDGDLDIPE